MKSMTNPYLATVLLSMTAQAATAERLADPTRPATAKAVATTETAAVIKIEAIMNSAQGQLALVNGKVVRAGDFVNGVRIDEILSDGVRYTRAGQTSIAYVGKRGLQVRHNVTAHEDQT